MSNLVIYEVLNRFDISSCLFVLSLILSFTFTYKLSLKGLIYKVYLLNLCIGILYIYGDASYSMNKVENIVYKHSWNDIVSVIEKNKQLAGLIGTVSDLNDDSNILIRTNTIIDRNYVDMFVYRMVDMTQYIPNDLSPNRWEQTIKDIEYITENTHNNLIYGELPLILKDMIYKLNNVINPWSLLISDNHMINRSLIKKSIIYMVYIDNEYVYNIEYVNVSVLSVGLICGYIFYILINICNKKGF
jgi:hypothetical protein